MEQNRKVEILKETAKEYIEKYPERVNQFRKEFEVDENDYIERDIDFFERIHIWLTDTDPYSEDWSYRRSDDYKIALKLAEQIGNEKICFALMAKIRFLGSKTSTPIQQADIDTRNLTPQRTETKTEQPKKFEELFYNPEHAEPCLRMLSELQPPVIDGKNNYIGKAKGVFPLWVMVLKSHKPEPLIKHFKDTIYKDLLNQKVKGLNLTKDASEFRKRYKRLENDKIELDIKTILSQYSQSGKLGK